MNYVESRMEMIKDFSKDLESLIENEMVEFDSTIFTCKTIIMQLEEIIRISEEKRMIRQLIEKGPF